MGYHLWFWDSQTTISDLWFEANSPALWLITRKILGINLFSCSMGLFYVMIEGYSTEHRGWELNTVNTYIYDKFVWSDPREHKSHPWFLFLTKMELETKILWSDLSSYSIIRKTTEKLITEVHVFVLDQIRISLDFQRQKWSFC